MSQLANIFKKRFQRFEKGPTLLKNLKRVRPFFRRVRPFQEGRRGFFKRGAAFWAAAGVLMLAGVGGTLALNGFFGGGAAIPEDTMTRGLAGYWSFDEGGGTIARDASGNNNHGTLTNGPQWSKGKNGNALQFDGKNDYVDCGSTSSLNGISGVVSVEAWARLDKLRYNSIVNKRTGNVEGHWDFRHSSNYGLQFVNFDSGGNPKIISAAATFDNDWHHLVAVATDSEVKIYMDGKRLATTGALAPIVSTSANVKIGGWGVAGNYYFNGQIDEVRVYNRALTEAEVKYHYNRGGPVAQWDMDEGSGSMIKDKSGNNNDGTLVNGTTWAQGKHGTALSFDGVDDYVDAGNKDDLDITGSITIEAWVKPSGLIGNGAGHHIANKMTSWRVNGYDFRIGTGSADRLQFITDSSASDVVSTTILQNDSWYHVVAVQEGVSYKKIYINGVQDGLKSNPAALISSSAANLKIGTYLSGGEYFNGQIDEVKIYDYARTEEEIRLDYNAGLATHLGPSGKTCSEDPAGCMDFGLAGHWDMDEGSGSILNDKSGNNNHGTLVNGPKWAQGKNGTALQFDGKDDYVNCGNNLTLQPASTVTLEYWMYPRKFSNGINERSVVGWRSIGKGIYTNLWNSDLYAQFWDGSAWQGIFFTLPSLNQWYHIVITYDASGGSNNYKIYSNGILKNQTTKIGNIVYTDGYFSIGNNTTIPFDGILDGMRLYNRALSAEEVRYHYNQGKPVAQWDMDEGSGSMIKDKSGNSNDGTISGATWAQGKHGTALSFDGTDDYVDAGNGSSLNITNAITIEAWVKPVNLTGSHHFIFKSLNYQVRTQDNKLRFVYQSTDNVWHGYETDADVFALNVWHHIVITHIYENGNSTKLYINGENVSGTWYAGNGNTPTKTSGNSLLVGKGGADFFNGAIDEVRVYNYARTAEEIMQDYNAGVATHLGPSGKTCSEDPAGCMDFGLAGHWDMDEGSGSILNDKSGNNNHGTLVNGPKWAQGKHGTALQFDGKDDYVNCGNGASLNIYDALSIEAWVRPDANKRADIVSRYSYSGPTNNGGYSLRFWDDGKFYLVTLNDSQGGISANGVVGKWNHVIATYDVNGGANNLKIYINGTLAGQTTKANALKSITQNLKIGAFSYYHDGSVDGVKIYNRALSAEEVRYHYNQGKPVAQWDFDEGEGTRAFDVSGNNNTGVLTNGPAWVEGKRGSALSFDGVDDYVGCGTDSSLNIADSMTASAWIYPKTLGEGGAGHIVGRGNTDGWVFYVYTGNSLKLCAGTTQAVSSANSITLNQWQYVTVVYDKQNIRFFVNGIERGVTVKTDSIVNTGSCVIGARTAAGDFDFNGYLDEVKIHNYARTAEQIMQDYNAGLATHLK